MRIDGATRRKPIAFSAWRRRIWMCGMRCSSRRRSTARERSAWLGAAGSRARRPLWPRRPGGPAGQEGKHSPRWTAGMVWPRRPRGGAARHGLGRAAEIIGDVEAVHGERELAGARVKKMAFACELEQKAGEALVGLVLTEDGDQALRAPQLVRGLHKELQFERGIAL